MSVSELMDEKDMADLLVSVPAEGLLHGAVWAEPKGHGWVHPWRFAKSQLKAIGSCRAWHPGLYRAMAACTAGITVEFETDSSSIVLEARVEPFPRGSREVLDEAAECAFAPDGPLDGFSCDVDGRHLPCALPEENHDGVTRVEFALDDPEEAPESNLQRLPGMGRHHHVRVWLPCLTSCDLRHVVGDGNVIEPVTARDQLLVIGDSIAQGFVAGDPARNWPALLATQLDMDVLNQGIGGQVFLPGSTVGLADEASPAAVVVELGENYRYEPCQEMRITRDIRTSLFEVAEAWPEASTWTLTPLWHLDETHPTHRGSCFAAVPDLIRTAVAANPDMHLVEGSRLLQASPVLMADGYEHPNADGSETIAKRLAYIMRALEEPAETRRARAIELLTDGPREAFPILECARRGIGEVLVAKKGVCVLEVPRHGTFVWGTSRKAMREALDVFASRDLVCVLGTAPVHDVRRDLGLTEDAPCNMVIYEKQDRLEVDPSLDIRTLTPAYAELVASHYSHPEYLAPGELEDILARGLVLGGFEAGRLCAFIGEHPEGAIGMLEVFPELRRRGWATALESAKINEQLDRGLVPWGEVWPDNQASIALQEKLGLTVYPEKGMHFMSRP